MVVLFCEGAHEELELFHGQLVVIVSVKLLEGFFQSLIISAFCHCVVQVVRELVDRDEASAAAVNCISDILDLLIGNDHELESHSDHDFLKVVTGDVNSHVRVWADQCQHLFQAYHTRALYHLVLCSLIRKIFN